MIFYRFDLVWIEFDSGVCQIQVQFDRFISGRVMSVSVKSRIRVKYGSVSLRFGSSSDKTYLEFGSIVD